MPNSDFITALTELCSQKGIAKEIVIEAIEAALVSAYKRNFGTTQNIAAHMDMASGEGRVYAQKRVVEEVTDPRQEIAYTEARRLNREVQLGEIVEVEMTPRDFGRIAAQTAKQVVTQRLREAEREAVYTAFTNKVGDIVSATALRPDPKGLIVQLDGKVEALMPPNEQVQTEKFNPGQHIQVYIVEVHRANKGPQIIVSRSHRNLLRRLFELQVPEIFSGTVEIKSIAREPGSRSKVAVAARQEGIDPVGACVGQRGTRIQPIVNELLGEKIDVVQWNADPSIFVAHALAPAQVEKVDVVPEDKAAYVVVADRQLSLAIGREGQNARLAAKLTGWRVDIKSASVAAREPLERRRRPVHVVGGDEESILKIRLEEAMRQRAQEEAEMLQRAETAFAGLPVSPSPTVEPATAAEATAAAAKPKRVRVKTTVVIGEAAGEAAPAAEAVPAIEAVPAAEAVPAVEAAPAEEAAPAGAAEPKRRRKKVAVPVAAEAAVEPALPTAEVEPVAEAQAEAEVAVEARPKRTRKKAADAAEPAAG
jgi:N utilization substance protein A